MDRYSWTQPQHPWVGTHKGYVPCGFEACTYPLPYRLAGLPARTRAVRKLPFEERSPTPQLGRRAVYTAKKLHRTDPICAHVPCQSTPSIDVRIVQTLPTRCGERVHPRRARSCKHVQSSSTHALYVQCRLDACTCTLPYMRTRTEGAVREWSPTTQLGSRGLWYTTTKQHSTPGTSAF